MKLISFVSAGRPQPGLRLGGIVRHDDDLAVCEAPKHFPWQARGEVRL